MSAYVHVCMFLTVGQTARPIWTKLNLGHRFILTKDCFRQVKVNVT